MKGARFNLNRLAPLLEDVHERLSGVVIENLDWLAFIDRYDRPGTLFYLDPPYWGSEDDYGKALFPRSQFEVLAERLARLRGQFILSINDVPPIRDVFAGFRAVGAELTYSVGGTRYERTRTDYLGLVSCETRASSRNRPGLGSPRTGVAALQKQGLVHRGIKSQTSNRPKVGFLGGYLYFTPAAANRKIKGLSQ